MISIVCMHHVDKFKKSIKSIKITVLLFQSMISPHRLIYSIFVKNKDGE